MVHLFTRQMRKTHEAETKQRIFSTIGKKQIFHVKKQHEKIFVINPNSHLCVTQYNTHVKTPVNINGWKTIAMINSGAIGNFMSFLFAQQSHMQTKKKKDQYGLEMADGSLKMVNEKTIPSPMLIQQHHEIITVDVFGLAAHNVILNIPWLKTHNPTMDWKTGILTFQRVGNVTNIEPIRRQRMAINEKKKTGRASTNKRTFDEKRPHTTKVRFNLHRGQPGKKHS